MAPSRFLSQGPVTKQHSKNNSLRTETQQSPIICITEKQTFFKVLKWILSHILELPCYFIQKLY